MVQEGDTMSDSDAENGTETECLSRTKCNVGIVSESSGNFVHHGVLA